MADLQRERFAHNQSALPATGKIDGLRRSPLRFSDNVRPKSPQKAWSSANGLTLHFTDNSLRARANGRSFGSTTGPQLSTSGRNSFRTSYTVS
jgi:hypothetical protein